MHSLFELDKQLFTISMLFESVRLVEISLGQCSAERCSAAWVMTIIMWISIEERMC